MNPEQTIVMITANSRGPIDFSRQQEVQMLQKPFELEKLDLLKAILSSMQSVEAEESNTKDLVPAFFGGFRQYAAYQDQIPSCQIHYRDFFTSSDDEGF